MARLPYPDEGSLTQEIERRIETLGRPLNIFRMLAHSPDTLQGVQYLGNTVLSLMSLSPSLREIAILRIAASSAADYEWAQHVPIARRCGVSREQVAALESDAVLTTCFSKEERMVIEATDELIRGPRLSDETLSGLRNFLSEAEVVELIVSVGFYMLIARFLESTGVEIEAELRRSTHQPG